MMVETQHTNRLRRLFITIICVMLLGQAAYAASDNTQESKDVITTGTVTADVLNVRSNPGLDQALVGKLSQGEKVIIGATQGEWYYIATDKVVGWAHQDYIGNVQKMTKEQYNGQTSNKAASIVSYAKQFIGKPYRSGATGPNAFDCSGLVDYVYSKYGVSVPRSSSEYASFGKTVPLSEIQPGDILCYHTSSKTNGISHVAIYAGNGVLIHAATERRGVTTDSINEPYYRSRLVRVARVL